MSELTAKQFGVTHAELSKLMAVDGVTAIHQPPTPIGGRSNPVSLLTAAIFLFTITVIVFIVTLILWSGYRSRKKPEEEEEKEKEDNKTMKEKDPKKKDVLPLDVDDVFHRASLQLMPFKEEELEKIDVDELDLSVVYYQNRSKLKIFLRKITLKSISEVVNGHAFVYAVVALNEPNDFFESELLPVANENYFRETSEFEMDCLDAISDQQIRLTVCILDRFAHHRQAKTFQFQLLPRDTASDATTQEKQPAIVISTTPIQIPPVVEKTTDTALTSGTIVFSICYMPTSGRLSFVALHGRYTGRDDDVPVGTYLKVSLVVSGKARKSLQTSTVRNSSCPVYNESFEFNSALEHIVESGIEVRVMTQDSNNASPVVLGKVFVGAESNSTLGRKHWELMLLCPRMPTAHEHGILS